jgi:hypothetical protein
VGEDIGWEVFLICHLFVNKGEENLKGEGSRDENPLEVEGWFGPMKIHKKHILVLESLGNNSPHNKSSHNFRKQND